MIYCAVRVAFIQTMLAPSALANQEPKKLEHDKPEVRCEQGKAVSVNAPQRNQKSPLIAAAQDNSNLNVFQDPLLLPGSSRESVADNQKAMKGSDLSLQNDCPCVIQ